MKRSPYSIPALEDVLENPRTASGNTLVRFIQRQLEGGVHPFFLEQGLAHMRTHFFLNSTSFNQATRLVGNALKKRPVPERANTDNHWSSSIRRILSPDTKAFQRVDPGVLHGALLEGYHALSLLFLNELPSDWEKDWGRFIQPFILHPDAELTLVYNALYLEECLKQSSDSIGDTLHKTLPYFFFNRVEKRGMQLFAEEFVMNWTPGDALRASDFLFSCLSSPFELREDELLEDLLRMYAKGSQTQKQATAEFLRYQPSHPDPRLREAQKEFLFLSTDVWLMRLKTKLKNLAVFHNLVKFLQVYPESNRDRFIFALMFTYQNKRVVAIDPEAEEFVKALVGQEVWVTLSVLTDRKYWRLIGRYVSESLGATAAPPLTPPEYESFVNKLKEVGAHLKRHDANLAYNFDVGVRSTGVTSEQAHFVWEYSVELLAGDNILASSHLLPHGSQVRRTADSFLGAIIPRIDIAQHPTIGENGAACKFKVFLADFPDTQITGYMDQEGKIEIDNIAVLSSLGGASLQAVVAETAASLVIPRYVPQLAPSPEHGGGIVFTGEVWSVSPTIHTVGKIEEDDPEADSIGNRINPTVAEWLFSWLLDLDQSRNWKLYRQTQDNVDGISETHLVTWSEAKELLQQRQITLSTVFTRTVRAHTKPVAVRLVNNTIVVGQVGERAKRNYKRFVADTGRVLDMESVVRKTYELPDGKRLVLDLPRTFNLGTFNDLEEVWQMLLDQKLKADARAAFRF